MAPRSSTLRSCLACCSTFLLFALPTTAGPVARRAPSFHPIGCVAQGNIGTGDNQGAGVRLADINGDGKIDYIWVDPKTGAATALFNDGPTPTGIKWNPQGVIAPGQGDGDGVVFADITGDGRADYIWISPEGQVEAWINGGPGAPGQPWKWDSAGTIARAEGAGSRGTLQWGDLNGDKKVDFVAVGPNGALTTFLSNMDGTKTSWIEIDPSKIGFGDVAGARLADIDGDGNADYVYLDADGKATVAINGGVPKDDSKGPTWKNIGVVSEGHGAKRENVILADMNGDKKADYVVVDPKTGRLDVWQN